jgi:hypothetical protein
MNQDNKEAGSDMKFLFWDDPGDSQENVDNQKNLAQTTQGNLTGLRKRRSSTSVCESSLQNGNTGEHYPEYQDYLDDTDEE